LNIIFRINPKERPNVVKLLRHKFISGIGTITKPIALTDEEKSAIGSPKRGGGRYFL